MNDPYRWKNKGSASFFLTKGFDNDYIDFDGELYNFCACDEATRLDLSNVVNILKNEIVLIVKKKDSTISF